MTDRNNRNDELPPLHMAGPWVTDHEIKVVEDAMRHWYEDKYWYCEEFERIFAEYHDRAHALMTPNCTSAIHLLLEGIGIGPGDEVIVPDCTWIASVAPIIQSGADPVFCDIDPHHWCLDSDAAESAINDSTKAILAVDLYGNMPDMDALSDLADDHDLLLLEDAAEALGSTYKGTRAGKFGVGSVFSFHRTKTLTTGEGGMLLLDDEDLYDRCAKLRDHGRGPDTPTYYNEMVAYKYMPFNVQAALGYAQFQRLDELLEKKRWIYESYTDKLGDIEDLRFNPEPEDGRNGAWITALVFGDSHDMTKDRAIDELGELDVPARPFFYPLTSIPAFDYLPGDYEETNTIAYHVSNHGINLPAALNLTEAQIDHVCYGVRTILDA